MKINSNKYKESFKVLAPPLSSPGSPPLPSSGVVVSPAATVVVVVSGPVVVVVVVVVVTTRIGSLVQIQQEQHDLVFSICDRLFHKKITFTSMLQGDWIYKVIADI